MGLVLLVAAPPPAARADIVAVARTTVTAGPALAGPAVVWGAPSGGSPFTVREAVPGAPSTAIYSAAPVRRDEQIAPLGLDGSSTRVALAYAVETRATGGAEAPTPLLADAFGGPLAGPLVSLARLSVTADQDLEPIAIGLSGDNVVLAEPADQFGVLERAHVRSLATPGAPTQDIGPVGIDGLDVAGPYVASSSSTHGVRIAVTNLAGAPVYTVAVPEARGPGLAGTCQSVTRTALGFAACGYALDADGTLAVAVEKSAGTDNALSAYQLYWASPTEPELHPIAAAVASSILAIGADRIVYVTPSGPVGERLDLTDLAGTTRPVSFQLPRNAVSGLAFDGTQLAWSTLDCVYGGTLPTSGPAEPPTGTCPQDEIAIDTLFLAHRRLVPVRVTCPMAAATGCRGTITLTAPLRSRTGAPRARSVAVAPFTVALNSTKLVAVRVAGHRLAGLPAVHTPGARGGQGARAVVLDATVRATDAAGLTSVQRAQLELVL